jgi:type I restriction enzyme S subunit
MKDSGVEWIGEIPSGWDSVKLKYIGFLYGGLSGKSGKDFNNDENLNNKPFIPFTNISDNTYISRDNLGMVNISEDEKQNRVEKNDLFFLMSSEDQEGIGKPSVLKEELGEVYLNTFCRGFRITYEKYDSLFVNYLLSGHSYRELLSVEGNGFTRINLRSHKVSDFQIFYPPKETQTQIVEYLDEQTQKIDSTIEKESQRTELLKEYRQSLISEVVTGKVDVRDWSG